MTIETTRVVTDDAVASSVLQIIREAREFVVLVSPYNAFWTHLKNEIQVATQRKVRVSAIYNSSSYARGDGIEWLLTQGATVYQLPNLHAKLYLNESSAMLSSMNLTQGSSRNSMDVGMLVSGTDGVYKDLLGYARRLVSLATRIEAGTGQSKDDDRQTEAPVHADNDSLLDRILPNRGELSKSALKTVRAWLTQGRCIRCRKVIPYAADNPLCDEHFAVWNRFGNKDYVEKYCHKCGKPYRTTYANPLCAACTRNPRSRPRLLGSGGSAAAQQPDDALTAVEQEPR